MSTSRVVPVLASALSFLALGCEDPQRRYDTTIAFPEARVLLERSARRLDLEITPEADYVLVDELRVKEDDELLDDELLTLRVDESAFRELTTDGACAGTIVGTPAGEIRFDEAFTTFDDGSDDGSSSCADFVDRLRGLIDGGSAPLLLALRTSAPTPQDPDDPVFFARELTIAADDAPPGDALELRMNVDATALRTCASMAAPMDCVGALLVLDEPFVARDDVSELKCSFPLELIVFHLDEQEVVEASATEGQLRLAGGTLLEVVDGTEIAGAKPDGEPPSETQLTTVQAVEDALTAGSVVRVDGTAVLQTTAPISLVGLELDMQIDPSATPSGEARMLAFQAPVLDVTPEVGVLTLPLDTDVRVTSDTRVSGDFTTLDALDQAVGDGASVRAEIVGPVETSEPRLVVRAESLRLTTRLVQ